MMRRFLAVSFIVASIALMGHIAVTRSFSSYYIDFASGSNSNAGTKASPWKSSPGMQSAAGCGGALHSYTHVPGDNFIYKGGVTWPNQCFPMSITNSGSSTSVRDTYTVDPTWFSGGSFTMPTFSGTGAAISIFVTISASNVTMSYFNMGGESWNGLSGAGDDGRTLAVIYVPTGFSNVTVSHSELHDWTLSTVNNNFTHEWVGMGYGKTAAAPNPSVVCDYCYIHDDANPAGYVGNCFYAITFTDGHCYALSEGAVGFADVHDNEINCIGYAETGCPASGWNLLNQVPNPPGPQHLNVLEVGNQGYEGSIWNNSIHDTAAGVTLYLCPGMNVYNNVFYNDPAQGDPPVMYDGTPSCGFTAPTLIANNTIDNAGGNAVRLGAHPGPMGAMTIKNNIWVNPSGSPITIDSGTTFTSYTATPNYPMPSAEAAAHGFTIGNKYSPSSPDSNVTAQGTNLTSLCSGTFVALCQDTSGAPWFGGSYKSRPTGSTGWDLGAYQGQGGSTGPPAISISAPSPGTVSGSQNLTASCVAQGTATCTSVQYTIDGFSFGAAQTSSPYTLAWNTATAANASHVIGATATDSNGQTNTASTVTVAVSNSIPGCFVSTDNDSGSLSWTANQAIGTQSANFTSTVVITPNTANQDSVFGLSQAAMNAYSQGAALLRFNSSGSIDVYKGSTGYTSDNAAPYSANTAYTFTVTVNFTGANAGTYSVAETSPTSIAIATNYAFRSTASFTSLGFINAISDNTTPDTAKVCNFQVGAGTSLSFSPASLNFGNVTVSSGMPTLTIGVTSSGGSTTFSSVGIAGDASFTINSNGCTGSQTSCSTVIKFAPTTTGVKNATVTYTDSATGSPQSYSVSGMGIPAASSATPSPTSVNFGNVQLSKNSTSGPIIVTLMNGPVVFSSVTFSNPDFAVASNTCTGSVSLPTCQTTITFTPSSLTNETATMTYTDNAPTGGSTQTVSLVGTGVNLPVSAPAVNFVWNGTIPIQVTVKGKNIGMDYPVTCNCTYANQVGTCQCQ